MSKELGELDRGTIRQVLERHPVELAVLFGSHARGHPSAESDIDIAVAFDDTVDADDRLSARIDLIVDLMEALETDAVDVADFDAIRPAVGAHAIRTGDRLLGDAATSQRYLDKFTREQSPTPESHEERMDRLKEIVDRLEAKL